MRMNISLLFSVLLVGWVSLALAQTDTAAPNVQDFDFFPQTINTITANQPITFTIQITDDLSGLSDGELGDGTLSTAISQARFVSPSRIQHNTVIFLPHNLVSGDTLDGEYVSTMVIPRFAEQGIWTLEWLLLADDVGNQRWVFPNGRRHHFPYPTSIRVLGFDIVMDIYLPILSK